MYDNLMKTKIIIWGTSMLSSMMYDILLKEDVVEVVGFTDYNSYVNSDNFKDKRFVAFENIDSYFDMNKCEILLTIGYSKMNYFREKIFNECKINNYKIHTYLSPNATILSNKIGLGSIVMPTVFVGPNVNLGDCTILNFNVCVSHDITIGDFCFLAGGVMMGGAITMGNNCFIGLNCTLRNGIRIGNKTLLGANIYLDKDTADNSGIVAASHKMKIVNSDILIDFV